MSTLPAASHIEEYSDQILGSLDDSWSLYPILQSQSNYDHEEVNNSRRVDHDQATVMDSAAGIVLDINGMELMKTGSTGSKIRKKNRKNSNENASTTAELELRPSVAKKLNHNAKERIRRMKLNASYLALRALLPDYRRSKKRWSAPAIVDRVLKYIPEVEREVESLRSHKEILQSEAKIAINDEKSRSSTGTAVFSLNQVNEEEAIIQACIAREDENKFRNLLQSIENEDNICIKSASAIHICEGRICCHLHFQINTRSSEADHQYSFEGLRTKVISWLT